MSRVSEPSASSEKIEKTLEQRMLESDVNRALADYSATVEHARRAQRLLDATNALIDTVNAGLLPEGHAVVTETSPQTPLSAVDDRYARDMRRHHAPERGTIVYTRSSEGELVERGEIVTSGGSETFIGDRIITTEKGLIIFNSDLNIGIPAYDKVEVVDLLNDPYENTLGGSHQKRFEQALGYLRQAQPGEVKIFDTGWY